MMQFTRTINVGSGDVHTAEHIVFCVENAMRNNFYQYELDRLRRHGPSILNEEFSGDFGPIDVKDAAQ